MAKFSVDPKKCIRCGRCSEACLYKIISVDNETNLPSMDKTSENICFQCGHCVIHCPVQAVKLQLPEAEYSTYHPEEKIALEFMPSQQQSEVFIKSRRSTRLFKKKAVEHETILQILGIAKYVPTAANSQLVRWIVVENMKTTEKIVALYYEWLSDQIRDNPEEETFKKYLLSYRQGYDSVFLSAPHLAVTVVPPEHYWPENATIAATYFELAAHSMSVGTCWGGRIIKALRSSSALRNGMGIKDNEQIGGLLLFGYPALPLTPYLPPRKDLQVSFI